MSTELALLPRFIRSRDAPAYLAMGREEFKNTVRPFVREFPIGERGVGFDRQELDEWASAYVAAKAIDKKGAKEQQSPRSERQEGETRWRGNRSQASPKGKVSGISTRRSTAKDFMNLLEQLTEKKQSAT
ncbi:hypothetical protein [Pseudomonas fluorescens]|uniref:hypothetical protein n=1 Tax=Pseudomonas fluorescens TaxID=294 RepID=UPI002E13FCD7